MKLIFVAAALSGLLGLVSSLSQLGDSQASPIPPYMARTPCAVTSLGLEQGRNAQYMNASKQPSKNRKDQSPKPKPMTAPKDPPKYSKYWGQEIPIPDPAVNVKKPRKDSKGHNPSPGQMNVGNGSSKDREETSRSPEPIAASEDGTPWGKGAAQRENEQDELSEEEKLVMNRSCRCLAADERCWGKLATKTNYSCTKRTKAMDQPDACKKSCCDYCRLGKSRWLCGKQDIRSICDLKTSDYA